jgi:hypothetical protein
MLRTTLAGRVGPVAVALVALSCPDAANAQASGVTPSSHVVIPFLASATRPDDLAFEGAECEVDGAGTTMDCEFQQVFLTTSDVAAGTCLITTNRYQLTFRRQSDARWVSAEEPAGECGLSNVVTLQDDGGVRWTMSIRRSAVSRDAPACRALEDSTETLTWQNLRRPLPCRFVQPGGLSR